MRAEPKHGTNSRYSSRRCRCQACRTAHAAYQREAGTNRRVGKRGEQKRQADLDSRAWCACGLRCTRGMATCRECWEAARQAKRDARRSEIARLWNDGARVDHIARCLGSTKNSINVTLSHMRADGWNVPHRRAGWGKP